MIIRITVRNIKRPDFAIEVSVESLMMTQVRDDEEQWRIVSGAPKSEAF